MSKNTYLKIYYALFFIYIVLSFYNDFTFVSGSTLVESKESVSLTSVLMSLGSFLAFILFVISIIVLVKIITTRKQKVMFLLPIYHILAYIGVIILGISFAFSNIAQGIPKEEAIIPSYFQSVGIALSSLGFVILLTTIYYLYLRK